MLLPRIYQARLISASDGIEFDCELMFALANTELVTIEQLSVLTLRLGTTTVIANAPMKLRMVDGANSPVTLPFTIKGSDGTPPRVHASCRSAESRGPVAAGEGE